jgi:hypothetical protein
MTVNELIAELRKQPPELRVVVSGYEEGFDDISRLTPISIAPKPSAKEWEGRWRDEESGETAILLFGRGRD